MSMCDDDFESLKFGSVGEDDPRREHFGPIFWLLWQLLFTVMTHFKVGVLVRDSVMHPTL
jgi:hypothetical protein